MPSTATTPLGVYADLSPNDGQPLTRGKPAADWFTSAAADQYVTELLQRFEERHPDAAKELAVIANEAKWSTGWKGFGRSILEIVG